MDTLGVGEIKDMADTTGRPPFKFGLGLIVILILVALMSARAVARFLIEYQWWQEMGQLETWYRMLSYNYIPGLAAALLVFALFWIAHARGMKRAGTRLGEYPVYARLATAGMFVLSLLVAAAAVDSWTIMRFVGGLGVGTEGAWRDPVFDLPLKYYFFHVPFYALLLRLLMVATLFTGIIYWLTARVWSLRSRMPEWNAETGVQFDLRDLNLGAALETRFIRVAGGVFLLALAVRYFLKRYELLYEDHSSLVGMDWTAQTVTMPLLWACVAAAVLAAVGLFAGRWKLTLLLPAVIALSLFVPTILYTLYVRPSEITIQAPYITRHIAATREAYGLTTRSSEVDFPASQEAPVDPTKHRTLFNNVRLWDWRAFHDTTTQIQALRPYYVFHDTDVDRYMIDGQLRQVLLAPRELDVNQLPADAKSRWINPHFIYTHGYGMVVAEAARITADGLPQMLVLNAPAEVRTESLKLTRPEIYYGEVTHEPVFVRTAQPEFNYPSGSGNVETRYSGKGGFPISSPPMRLAAALATGDWNIVLTSYLKPESRMMIRRKVRERVSALASFLHWDPDPYLVIRESGQLAWIIDGYTTANSHPYSRSVRLGGIGEISYIRNSVKAVVDAYDGTVTLYVFDEKDPVMRAYQHLFPKLFTPGAEMPADLRAHARYPEFIFRVQAEIYRTFHMTNTEAFFNKEDVWEVARNLNNPSGRAEPGAPTYVVATLPGEEEPEFLLMTTFTPRNKDNMIGLMLARCDGDKLGELTFLKLSKQELMFGSMQIEARINQDQFISKDLSLWNQQGSQVLRGQMLVLPVDDTFVYIEPIYLQAAEARMPQLKKVVIAVGNRLIYEDTYEEALSALAGQEFLDTAPLPGEARAAADAAADPAASAPAVTPAAAPPSETLMRLRNHLRRYRELQGQGKYGEAGREMEAIEKLISERASQ